MALGDSGASITTQVTGDEVPLIASFLAVAVYNVIELNFIIATTFKRRHGLYFWSFVVATYGILVYSIGFILRDFVPPANIYLYVTFIVVGWCPMVTGQSMVLYSRLHLVVYNQTILRCVLIMIIVNAVILHIPTVVLIYASNSSHPGPFIKPYSVYEKFQVIVFFVQEMTISGLYIWETSRLLRIADALGHENSRTKMMRNLIAVNVGVALIDVAIMALELADLYNLQTSYKALSYSVKLKLEFSILNRLVDFVRSRSNSSNLGMTDPSVSVDMENLSSQGSRPQRVTSSGMVVRPMSRLEESTTRDENCPDSDSGPGVGRGGAGSQSGTYLTADGMRVRRDSVRRVQTRDDATPFKGIVGDKAWSPQYQYRPDDDSPQSQDQGRGEQTPPPRP